MEKNLKTRDRKRGALMGQATTVNKVTPYKDVTYVGGLPASYQQQSSTSGPPHLLTWYLVSLEWDCGMGRIHVARQVNHRAECHLRCHTCGGNIGVYLVTALPKRYQVAQPDVDDLRWAVLLASL